MYTAITANKYSDLTENQWQEYYNLRLLLDESLDSQTLFKSFSDLQKKLKNISDDKSRRIIITKNGKFIAIIFLERLEKDFFFNARLDFYFDCLLYDIESDMVNLVKKCIIDFKQPNEPVYYQASSFKHVELIKNLGGKLSDDSLSFKLDLDDIAWDNINSWYKNGKNNNQDLKLKIYKGLPKNKQRAQEILTLWEMVDRDIPNEENYCDFFSDRSYVTDGIKENSEYGVIDYFCTLSNKNDNKIIGLTHVVFNPYKPNYAGQSISGIVTEYRNRGLCKYLKAAMLKKILKDYPDKLKGIRTSISRVNYPILKITKQMGFRFKSNSIAYKLNFDEK